MAIILTDSDAPKKEPMQRTPPGFIRLLHEEVKRLSEPRLSRWLGPTLYGPDGRLIDWFADAQPKLSATIRIQMPQRYQR
jgi:hypothetical protein